MIKSHKGADKVRDEFIIHLDRVGSFSKDNIPIYLIKSMQQKSMLGGSLASSSWGKRAVYTKINLKTHNRELHDQLHVSLYYQESIYYLEKRQRSKGQIEIISSS